MQKQDNNKTFITQYKYYILGIPLISIIITYLIGIQDRPRPDLVKYAISAPIIPDHDNAYFWLNNLVETFDLEYGDRALIDSILNEEPYENAAWEALINSQGAVLITVERMIDSPYYFSGIYDSFQDEIRHATPLRNLSKLKLAQIKTSSQNNWEKLTAYLNILDLALRIKQGVSSTYEYQIIRVMQYYICEQLSQLIDQTEQVGVLRKLSTLKVHDLDEFNAYKRLLKYDFHTTYKSLLDPKIQVGLAQDFGIPPFLLVKLYTIHPNETSEQFIKHLDYNSKILTPRISFQDYSHNMEVFLGPRPSGCYGCSSDKFKWLTLFQPNIIGRHAFNQLSTTFDYLVSQYKLTLNRIDLIRLKAAMKLY